MWPPVVQSVVITFTLVHWNVKKNTAGELQQNIYSWYPKVINHSHGKLHHWTSQLSKMSWKKATSPANIKQWTAGIPEDPIPHHRKQGNLCPVIFVKVQVSRIASFTHIDLPQICFEFKQICLSSEISLS